ncbi:hypothetical protein HYX15_01995 [Candidatus Woesearchaeota archaeon]|nr:hypothetical protein [Candidatus Woesearchaeota archaeon]
MTDLIACLSTGKGTWGHISRLIQDGEWENIYLITNEFGKENFTAEKKAEIIVIDPIKPIKDLIVDVESKLKDKVNGEIALNLISGTGKEHMAILSALLKLGVGIRLVALTKDGVEEL